MYCSIHPPLPTTFTLVTGPSLLPPGARKGSRGREASTHTSDRISSIIKRVAVFQACGTTSTTALKSAGPLHHSTANMPSLSATAQRRARLHSHAAATRTIASMHETSHRYCRTHPHIVLRTAIESLPAALSAPSTASMPCAVTATVIRACREHLMCYGSVVGIPVFAGCICRRHLLRRHPARSLQP